VKELASRARAGQEQLEARVAALEAAVAQKIDHASVLGSADATLQPKPGAKFSRTSKSLRRLCFGAAAQGFPLIFYFSPALHGTGLLRPESDSGRLTLVGRMSETTI